MGSGENMKVSLAHQHLFTAHRCSALVDYILFIKAEVDLDVNPNEVQETRYVSDGDLRAMFNEGALKFTPWFQLICQSLLFEWWEHLDRGLEAYQEDTTIKRM